MASATRSTDEYQTFRQFLNSLAADEPLSKESNANFAVLAKAGDAEKLSEVVRRNRKLIINNIYKWHQAIILAGATHSDCFNEACLMLLDAVDKYEPEISAFSTYASFWINAGIRKAIDEANGQGRLPRSALRDRRRVNKVLAREYTEKGTAPKIRQLAKLANVTPEMAHVVTTCDLGTVSTHASIGDPERGANVGDILTDEDAELLDESYTLGSAAGMLKGLREKALNKRERLIIECRFYQGMSLVKTAEVLARKMNEDKVLSRERLRQLETKALGKLHVALTGEERPKPAKRKKHQWQKRRRMTRDNAVQE